MGTISMVIRMVLMVVALTLTGICIDYFVFPSGNILPWLLAVIGVVFVITQLFGILNDTKNRYKKKKRGWWSTHTYTSNSNQAIRIIEPVEDSGVLYIYIDGFYKGNIVSGYGEWEPHLHEPMREEDLCVLLEIVERNFGSSQWGTQSSGAV